MFNTLKTSGIVREDGAIVLTDSAIPEKYRVRYWMNSWPTGTALNVELLWQIDNYQGKEYYDSFLRTATPK